MSKYILPALFIGLFAGCSSKVEAPKKPTVAAPRVPAYPHRIGSILVLPPMNETTDAEAKGHYMTTIEEPLIKKGYYVFPVEIVSEVMKQEGVYDTERLYNLPLDKFREYFGADAVMFTRIRKWDTSYAVVASQMTVVISAEIRSTTTSRVLWQRNAAITKNLSQSGNFNSLGGLLAKTIVTALNTATADYVDYARIVTRQLAASLPTGPYDVGCVR